MNPPENYTLFILGAGANVPYGYPTAIGLKHLICQHFEFNYKSILRNRPDLSKIENDWHIQNFIDFKEKFLKSPTPSIDLFLSRNPEYEYIGKTAILITLLNSEKVNLGNGLNLKEPNWLEYLFNKITNNLVCPEDYKLFNTATVKFVTFNYDRLLEAFFLSAMQHTFNKYKNEVIEKVKEIPIEHVYGHLGLIPLLAKSPYDESIFDYGHDCNYQQSNKLIKNIKLIQDRESLENNTIKEWVRNATRIFFLGFGFGEENLKVLGIPNLLNDKQEIYGTAFGMTAKEIARIKAKFTNLEQDTSTILDTDCLTLLREYL